MRKSPAGTGRALGMIYEVCLTVQPGHHHAKSTDVHLRKMDLRKLCSVYVAYWMEGGVHSLARFRFRCHPRILMIRACASFKGAVD
jgi:hypothetical protein